MAKSYKKKFEHEEVEVSNETLSKKELYDLEKKKKMNLKEQDNKKNKKVLKNNSKNNSKQTNLGTRTFAILMLILMIGSVLVSALAYVLG